MFSLEIMGGTDRKCGLVYAGLSVGGLGSNTRIDVGFGSYLLASCFFLHLLSRLSYSFPRHSSFVVALKVDFAESPEHSRQSQTFQLLCFVPLHPTTTDS